MNVYYLCLLLQTLLRLNSIMKNLILSLLFFIVSTHWSQAFELATDLYKIVSVSDHKIMDVPAASRNNGTQIYTYNDLGYQFNQLWHIEAVQDYFIIRSRCNNKVLSLRNDTIIQHDYEKRADQHWKLEEKGEDLYFISSEKNLAITVNDKRELFLAPLKKGNDAQKWQLKSTLLSPGEMKEDVEYFFSKLHEVHVNPYAFVSKDSLEQRKKDLLAQVSDPMPYYKFMRTVSALNQLFDGHTGINEMSYAYANQLENINGGVFPYPVKYDGVRFIVDNIEDSDKEYEIKSINGMDATDIRDEIENRISLESRSMRNMKIENNFAFYLLGLFDLVPPYELSVVDLDNKEETKIKEKGIPSHQIPKRKLGSSGQYSFRTYKEESIAIIEYNTCKPNNIKAFNMYIDSVFNVVKLLDIQHLFIDISRNGGGSTNTNDIFYKNINHYANVWYESYTKRISQESKLHYFDLSEYYSSEPLDVRLKQYKKRTQFKRLYGWANEIAKIDNGGLFQTDIAHCTDIVENGYANRLYIIQSPLTYSAATDMSAWFKYSNVGNIIGTETGGMSAVYIESIPFRLPNSNISFRVSDNYCAYPNGSIHQGVMPDVRLSDDFVRDQYSLDDLKSFIEKVNKQH